MACLQFQLLSLKNFSPKSFLHLFRNVKKLKYPLMRACEKHMCTTKPNFHYFQQEKSCLMTSSIPELKFFPNMFLYCHRDCSRWVRNSQNAFITQTSRRKQRSKSVQLTDRIKTRHHSTKLRDTKRNVAKKMGEIKENILTVPNGLCVLRILATPVLGYLVLAEFYTTSLGLFIFAGCTDLIDGFIARNFPNQQTMIGSFLDPAADKLLIATLFITLTANGLIPVPLTSLIIIRDACLMGAGFYIRYVSLPPPKTLSRYFDMSFVTAKLSPTAISKANTLIQLSLVAASLAAPVFSFVDHLYLHILWYITGTTTVLSAASYLYFKNRTYKLFTLSNRDSRN